MGQHGLKCLTCDAVNADPRSWGQDEPFCPDCQDNGKEEAWLVNPPPHSGDVES